MSGVKSGLADSETHKANESTYDVIVVGAGAAGIGVGITLQHVGIEKYVIVDRANVGASFAAWPAETRFITPSFPSNSIGMLDLNSIAIGVSPAYNMRVEHPTGAEYAKHLQNLADYFELPVKENTNVSSIEKVGDVFQLETENETMMAKYVIWSAGEYQCSIHERLYRRRALPTHCNCGELWRVRRR